MALFKLLSELRYAQEYDWCLSSRWLPVDVVKMSGRHLLQCLLEPNSDSIIPVFPPNFLSLPLMSILNIARENGLQASLTSYDESDTCAVCLERACSVAAEGCRHQLCVKCILYLCSTSSISSETVGPPGSTPCPICRYGIVIFVEVPGSPETESEPLVFAPHAPSSRL